MTTRRVTPEEIGYIVIESGRGSIDGVDYVVGVGADTIVGPDDGLPATYSLMGLASASSAVVSAAGMNGADGGWAVLAGNNAVSTNGLQLFFDEDRWGDTERSHIPEQVAYFVFGELSEPNLRTGIVANVSTTAWTTVTLDHDVRQHGGRGQCELYGGRSAADDEGAQRQRKPLRSPGAARRWIDNADQRRNGQLHGGRGRRLYARPDMA